MTPTTFRPLLRFREQLGDALGLPAFDPGPERVVEEALAWLGRAQDRSVPCDGGVARHFSLQTGWSSSYPETTGYIVPTLLACAHLRGDEQLRERARRMLDWLVSVQLPDGAFPGGPMELRTDRGVTFNTGQILLGLAAGVREFGDAYREPMRRAADWLVNTQDADGCWRKFPSPFVSPGEKVYETHVSWGLLEAERVEPGRAYAEKALANVRWALTLQRDNGWFEKCCLNDVLHPLTHTLGYVLRGVLEVYRFAREEGLLRACRKTADGLLGAISPDGYLPGRLDSDWRGAVKWACVTGSVQIAYCWLELHRATGDMRYRNAAFAANRYVRRTVKVDGPEDIRGAVKGSFPINGEYGHYEYLNWAAKFTIDSNLLEKTVREEKGPA
ncbi:MAG: hypothetical protein L0212_00390 [Acidobacteria bacterium]|nr:hypothetical protein [Acidobacteriota bacterium]